MKTPRSVVAICITTPTVKTSRATCIPHRRPRISEIGAPAKAPTKVPAERIDTTSDSSLVVRAYSVVLPATGEPNVSWKFFITIRPEMVPVSVTEKHTTKGGGGSDQDRRERLLHARRAGHRASRGEADIGNSTSSHLEEKREVRVREGKGSRGRGCLEGEGESLDGGWGKSDGDGASPGGRATPAPLAVLYRTATGAARPAGQEKKNEKETTRGGGAECRFAPTCGHGARRMNNSEHGDSHSGLGQGAQSWVATRPRATHPSRAGLPTSNQHIGDPKRSADRPDLEDGGWAGHGGEMQVRRPPAKRATHAGQKGKREKRKGESSERSRRTVALARRRFEPTSDNKPSDGHSGSQTWLEGWGHAPVAFRPWGRPGSQAWGRCGATRPLALVRACNKRGPRLPRFDLARVRPEA
ncbi:hypothetical protein L1887_48892 [Cichorium endivia]|nr:hypothetical protein L1887_48892 [Cichorium endivia]